MGRLSLVDPQLQLKLRKSSVPLELVDERGVVVGNFTPSKDYWLSDEELADALREDRLTYTTEEVLAHLGSLG
jgi:hypothetical protein